MKGAQIGTVDIPFAGGADTDRRHRPAGPGRPGRAGGWRTGQAQGPAGHANGTGAPPAGGQGLVPSAITVRDLEERTPADVSELWQPSFPSPELVEAAADLLPSIEQPSGRDAVLGEGPRWEIVVSPGVIRVRTRDYARAERTYERQLRHHQADVDIAAAYLANGEEVPEPLPTRGTIYAWSAKSRARLVARLSDLDYTRLYGRYRVCSECTAEHSDQLDHCPSCLSSTARVVDRTGRLPAMLTLTYPGDWLTVAPDAETVKRHFTALAKRYERAWGEPLIGPWKLEFQRRGAPHFHISTTPPMGFTTITDPETNEPRWADFRTWLSWPGPRSSTTPTPNSAAVIALAGTGVDYAEGIKLTDPRRMAIYFAKYGTSGGKEYQHQVPREWCTAVLVCDDCTAEYDADHDDCPECGSLEAELVEHGSGPGRFWGYRGLRPVLAIRQVTADVGVQAGRLLRRWYRAKRLTRTVTVERVEQATGRVYTRRSRVRKRLFARGRGFACVNDGPAFASQLARQLLLDVPESGLPRGADNVRPGAGAGASVERPTGRTTEAPATASGSPTGAP